MAAFWVKPSRTVTIPQEIMIRANQRRAPTLARMMLAGTSNRK